MLFMRKYNQIVPVQLSSMVSEIFIIPRVAVFSMIVDNVLEPKISEAGFIKLKRPVAY